MAVQLWFDIVRANNLALLHSDQTGSGMHTAPYRIDEGDSFLES
jgi:hypothetical protein